MDSKVRRERDRNGCRRGAHGHVGRGGSPGCWRRWRSSASASRSAQMVRPDERRAVNARRPRPRRRPRSRPRRSRRRRRRPSPRRSTRRPEARARARPRSPVCAAGLHDAASRATTTRTATLRVLIGRPVGDAAGGYSRLLLHQGRLPRQGRAVPLEPSSRSPSRARRRSRSATASTRPATRPGSPSGTQARAVPARRRHDDGAGHGPGR